MIIYYKASVMLGQSLPFLALVLMNFSQAADPCGQLSAVSANTKCTTFDECSRLDRVKTMCSFKDAMLADYAPLFQKEKRIKTFDGKLFDSIAHLDGCIQREAHTAENSGLQFYDRMRLCVAGFQDTHLNVKALVRMPTVYLGFELEKIDDHYVIARTYPKVLAYIEATHPDSKITEALAIGGKILSIDGQDPKSLAKSFEPYLSASSDLGRERYGVEALTTRNFRYPEKNTVSLLIESNQGKKINLILPWWTESAGSQRRKDAFDYLKSIGIPTSDRIKFGYINETDTLKISQVDLSAESYQDSIPYFKQSDRARLNTYLDDDNEPAVRSGIIALTKNKSVCYLQILTFDSSRITPDIPKADSVDFFKPIKDLISECEGKDLDLVLDLRSNGGGDGNYPPKLLSLLTRKGEATVSKAIAFRTTSSIGKLLYSRAPKTELGAIGEPSINVIVRENFELHWNRDPFTDLIVDQAPRPELPLDGFSGKIVATITPNCVSACDSFVRMLSNSGRAQLVGTPTSGTGAGFRTADLLDFSFKDRLSQFKINIPNYLFGVSDLKTPTDQIQTLNFSDHEDWLMENRPTQPNMLYNTSLIDIESSSAGWLKAVMTLLYPPEGPVTRAPSIGRPMPSLPAPNAP